MGAVDDLRARAALAANRTAARALKAAGLREAFLDGVLAVRRARRARLERAGSRKLAYPALHELDRKLDRLLDRDGGFFVEAGGHDGYTQSNTYFLARFRGWRGVLVEPSPTLVEVCRAERPESRVVQAALVAPEAEGTTVVLHFGDLMSTVEGAVQEEGWNAAGLAPGWRDPYEAEVPGRTLSAVLDEAGAPEVDLLSLDVEGFEVPALRGLDLDRHAPRWIAVEAHDEARDRPPLDELLGGRYVSHGRITPTDLLFRRADVPEPAALRDVLL